MCVKWTSEWEKTDKDLVAFKMVTRREGRLESYYPTYGRTPQRELGEDPFVVRPRGRVKRYEVGQTAKSAKPGLYCYLTKKGAERDLTPGSTMLKVKIPKGTEVRRGVIGFMGSQAICATTIVVESIEKEVELV